MNIVQSRDQALDMTFLIVHEMYDKDIWKLCKTALEESGHVRNGDLNAFHSSLKMQIFLTAA